MFTLTGFRFGKDFPQIAQNNRRFPSFHLHFDPALADRCPLQLRIELVVSVPEPSTAERLTEAMKETSTNLPKDELTVDVKSTAVPLRIDFVTVLKVSSKLSPSNKKLRFRITVVAPEARPPGCSDDFVVESYNKKPKLQIEDSEPDTEIQELWGFGELYSSRLKRCGVEVVRHLAEMPQTARNMFSTLKEESQEKGKNVVHESLSEERMDQIIRIAKRVCGGQPSQSRKRKRQQQQPQPPTCL
eukprot:c11890_g1_i3.p1 GENE.c11890_g1_i3~~c11890_g1_i3.p1  ORF type:complete len:263 (+),score=65.65 c11890_g1_i3:60-791(+)